MEAIYYVKNLMQRTFCKIKFYNLASTTINLAAFNFKLPNLIYTPCATTIERQVSAIKNLKCML